MGRARGCGVRAGVRSARARAPAQLGAVEVDGGEQLVERAAQRVQPAQVALVAQRAVGCAVLAREPAHVREVDHAQLARRARAAHLEHRRAARAAAPPERGGAADRAHGALDRPVAPHYALYPLRQCMGRRGGHCECRGRRASGGAAAVARVGRGEEVGGDRARSGRCLDEAGA